VEDDPSLSRAYALGAHSKFALTAAVGLASLLVGVMNGLLGGLGNLLLPQNPEMAQLFLIPVTMTASWIGYIVSTAIPAIAYRTLAGLPDPDAPGEQTEGA